MGYLESKAVVDFAHKLGFGKQESEKEAEKELGAIKDTYGQLSLPDLTRQDPKFSQAVDQGASSYNDIVTDPQYKEAQLEQLAALRNLAANGGRNAASDADLARIQQAEGSAARGQRDAILQNANARGMGGAGASLLAQLSASQNATNNQSMQDLNVRGQDQSNALQAATGAANVGASMQNNDFNQQAQKAAANDAIARFNAGQRTGTNQYNTGVANNAQQFNTGLQQQEFGNQFQKQAGIAGAHQTAVNFKQGQADRGAQQAGNLLGAVFKGGATAASAFGGGAGGAAGGAGAGAAGAAAHGGRIPGIAPMAGDNMKNDTVRIDTSPDEVVVPRSLAKHGTSLQISDFVKHPPQIKMNRDVNKEAMLSALQNLRRRG